jgi:hypothetical protein
MVDDKGVVTSTENMVEVYKKIYDRMVLTNNATANDLNTAYAKYLTAAEQGDIDAVSTMEEAMGMSYETLGAILSKEGESLE